MSNILYIFGWNSSPESDTLKTLQELLPEHNVTSIAYNQNDPEEAINFFNTYIPNNNINLVIASSYGAFIASQIKHSIFKILINPCLQPSTEIPKLASIPNKFLESCIYLESLKKVDDEERHFTHAFFSTNDELFSHKNIYKSLGYHHLTDLPSEKHKLSRASLQKVSDQINISQNLWYNL